MNNSAFMQDVGEEKPEKSFYCLKTCFTKGRKCIVYRPVNYFLLQKCFTTALIHFVTTTVNLFYRCTCYTCRRKYFSMRQAKLFFAFVKFTKASAKLFLTESCEVFADVYFEQALPCNIWIKVNDTKSDFTPYLIIDNAIDNFSNQSRWETTARCTLNA